MNGPHPHGKEQGKENSQEEVKMAIYCIEFIGHPFRSLKKITVTGTLSDARKKAISWGKRNDRKIFGVTISKQSETRPGKLIPIGIVNILSDIDVYKWETFADDAGHFKAWFINPKTGNLAGFDDEY